jgi:hypothetical protein
VAFAPLNAPGRDWSEVFDVVRHYRTPFGGRSVQHGRVGHIVWKVVALNDRFDVHSC